MPTKTHTANTDLISENGTGQSLIERLREKSRLRTKTVSVPRWEMEITLRELSAKEVREMRSDLKSARKDSVLDEEQRMGTYLIARSCIDPATGGQLFSPADVALLYGDDLAIAPLQRLVKAISEFNGLGEDGVKQAEQSFPAVEG